MNMPDQPSAPETVTGLLDTIQSYFATLANTERLSLAETEESGALCLEDATRIGSTGLDLVEDLRTRLMAPATAAVAPVDRIDTDPLAELKNLPLDRVVMVHLQSGQSFTGALAESPDNQIILFEPRPKNVSRYHAVPIASICAWTDMRGDNADPLFLYGQEYLTQREITRKTTSDG